MQNKKILVAMLLVAIMVGSSFVILTSSSTVNNSINNGVSPIASGNIGVQTVTPGTSTEWQMPTTTMQEPGYTNGTFTCGIDCSIGDLNTFTGITFGELFIYKLIYGSLYKQLTDGSYVPWLATNYSVKHVTQNNETFDIETNSMVNYSYVYTINLRPYVQWTDWSAANASQTYTFSNYTSFHNKTGVKETHTYKSFKSTTMKKYYLQSADVVLSWRIESSLGGWPNVVNVIPNGNLSVKMFVSEPTLLITTSALESYILPYHIWVHHDYTSIEGLFNYTPGSSSGNGYYNWNLGWNSATGSAPGLVGDGPFMINNGYGLPQGQITPDHEDLYYVNSHFFTQYANESSGLRQYTPKIYEFYQPYYASASSQVAAFTKGSIDMLGFTPEFKNLVAATPGAYIYHAASDKFCGVRLNENYTPLNITQFREALSYAVPYSYIDTVICDGELDTYSNTVPPSNVLWVNSSTPQYIENLAKASSMIDSIPGMKNTTSGLTYDGKQVCLQIQIAPGSETPASVQEMTAMAHMWNTLGIKTVIVEEAYSTMFANTFCTVMGHGNRYQVAAYGQGTETADPAELCALFVNKATSYFSVGCTLGPYTSMKYNGKELSGAQVTNLLTNLSNELIAATTLSSARAISGKIQTIIVEQATLINLGYTETQVAYQTNQFTNFTLLGSNNILSTYFTLLSVYKTKNVITLKDKYHLDVSQKFNGKLVETVGDTGSIAYTVYNGTTGKPVQGASVGITVSSIAKGLTNVSSNNLVTNSNGVAVWTYRVSSLLDNLLKTTNSNCAIINVPSEVANVSAVIGVPSGEYQTVGNQTYQNIVLTNNEMKDALSVSSIYTGPDHLYSGQSGSISYTVKNSTGSAVADANITIVVSGIPNSITSTLFDFNTTTGATGTFNFNVSSILPKLMQTFSSAGNPVNIYDQEIEITAVASIGNQNQTGAGTASNTVFLINPSLNINYTLPQFNNMASGMSYRIQFKVTENGTAVSGASVSMTDLNFKGISYSSSNLNMITNSSGMSVFTFSFTGTAGTYNQTFSVETNTTNASIVHGTANVVFQTPSHSSSALSSTDLYIIIGVVLAIVVIGSVAVYMRKLKHGKTQ